MWPKARRVGDKGETSVNSCGPTNPEWGDKGETSVNSCGPTNPEWETSVRDKFGRQVGDKCKLMPPKAPRVRDKCGRQGGDKCKLMRHKAPRVGDKGETSVNSCGPRHPE